jgi:N-acyl homoserine lactone hydrolase
MVSASPAVSRAGNGTPDPVRAVSVISTGTVEIHPEHAFGTSKPLYWWLLTSRRWLPPRPINVDVIEHANWLLLFDTGQDRASVTDEAYFPGGFTGVLYDRLARFHISEHETLTAQLATLGYAPADVDTAILSHLHQDHMGGLRELAGADLLVARSLDVMGDGSLVLLPTPGHTPGSLSLLIRRRTRSPVLLVGDLSYEAALLQRRQLPGVGGRRQLATTTDQVLALKERMPDLAILPAHDPTAAQRLLES